jgi:hypothetical protein
MAEGIALCRPEVICAYPFTPQPREGLGQMVRTGELKGLRGYQRRVGACGAVGCDRRLGGRQRETAAQGLRLLRKSPPRRENLRSGPRVKPAAIANLD